MSAGLGDVLGNPLIDHVIQLAADLDSGEGDARTRVTAVLEQLRSRHHVYRLVSDCRSRRDADLNRAATRLLTVATVDRWFPRSKCGSPVGPDSFAGAATTSTARSVVQDPRATSPGASMF